MRRSVALRIAVIGLSVTAGISGTALAVGGGVHAVSVEHSPRVCRSAKTWGPAPDKFRPCVRITGVQEDGSFSFSVSDADGTVRYSAGVGARDR